MGTRDDRVADQKLVIPSRETPSANQATDNDVHCPSGGNRRLLEANSGPLGIFFGDENVDTTVNVFNHSDFWSYCQNITQEQVSNLKLLQDYSQDDEVWHDGGAVVSGP